MENLTMYRLNVCCILINLFEFNYSTYLSVHSLQRNITYNRVISLAILIYANM